MDYFDIYSLVTILISDIIIILGLIGSVLSFLVFSRKAFARSSINIYCRALAIFDCFTVIYLIFNTGSDTNHLNFLLSVKNTVGCKVFYFFMVGISPISGWILVMFSIDQAITVSYTTRLAFIKQTHFQILIVLFLALFHIGVYSVIPIDLDVINTTIESLNQSTLYCNLNNLRSMRALNILYLIETNFLPFFILMLTTGYILKSLRASTQRLSQFTITVSVTISRSTRMKKSKQKKFAINSVVLNILFVVLTCPVAISFIFQSNEIYYDIMVEHTVAIFFFLNYSLHFLTHFLFNSIFRRHFFHLFSLKSKFKY